MANLHVLTGAGETPAFPVVRKIKFADLKDAVMKGVADFTAMPTHAIPLCFIYPVVGLLLFRLTFGYDVLPLLFPLAAGFALLGPFAAIGLYELSRQREQGVEVSWSHAFAVVRSPSLDSILALGAALMVIFVIWLSVAAVLYKSLFGYGWPVSVGQFFGDVFTTPQGWILIVVGNGVGFLFASVVFTISVVSFPLLLDRDVGAGVAVHTSIRAVLLNPVVMAAWGLFIAVALVVGSLPFLIGLAVVMPVLGHASWHVYRKVVEHDSNPRHERAPRSKGPRFAADFPAVLIPWSREDTEQPPR